MVSPEMLERYVQLEASISREEKAAVATELSHAVGRLEAAARELGAAQERQQRLVGRPDSGDESLRRILLDLGADRGAAAAAEHEEFVAGANKKCLASNEVAILSRLVDEIEEEVKATSSKLSYLQALYQEHDTLLGQVFGDTYGSEQEKRLELELDKVRGYRDSLAGGELEWREAASLAHSAIQLMDRALQCWRQALAQSGESRFHLATETRDCVQEAAIDVRLAKALLPSVEFPHCTARETAMILQMLVYVMTDLQIPERRDDCEKLMSAYHESAKKLHSWLHQTMDSSLSDALSEVEAQMASCADRLHKLRLTLIRNKMDAEDVAIFDMVQSRKSRGSISMDDVQDSGARIAPAGRRRLDHDVLFRSSRNLVVPPKPARASDAPGGGGVKLQPQPRKSKDPSGGQVWP